MHSFLLSPRSLPRKRSAITSVESSIRFIKMNAAWNHSARPGMSAPCAIITAFAAGKLSPQAAVTNMSRQTAERHSGVGFICKDICRRLSPARACQRKLANPNVIGFLLSQGHPSRGGGPIRW